MRRLSPYRSESRLLGCDLTRGIGRCLTGTLRLRLPKQPIDHVRRNVLTIVIYPLFQLKGSIFGSAFFAIHVDCTPRF